MKRPTLTTLSAKVRQYLGFSQEELSKCLGMSRARVAQAETHRYDYTPTSWLRLLGLAALLPPPIGTGPAEEAEAPLAADLDVAMLHERLRSCAYEARRLRQTLERRQLPRHHAHRWQQAQPVLAATLPADDAVDTPAQRRLRHWLPLRSADMADVLHPTASTELRLLQLRLQLLETEMDELRRWLGTNGTNAR